MKREVQAVLSNPRFYFSIAAVNPSGRVMFSAEPQGDKPGNSPAIFRTKDLLPSLAQPDGRVWTAGEQSVLCSITPHASLGETLRCTVPVFAEDNNPKTLRVALVADLRLDSLFEAARGSEFSSAADKAGAPSRQVIVLDASGKIVYHTNKDLRRC